MGHQITDPSEIRHVPQVLLAGGPGLLVDALRVALEAEKMVVTVAPAVDTAEIANLVAGSGCDVVVIPDRDADVTVDLVRSVVEAGSMAVTITRDPETIDAARFVNAGAAYVLGRDTSFSDLPAAIERLSRGKQALTLRLRYELEERLREHRKAEARRTHVFNELSARERAIFQRIWEGLSADQIAEEECVSISTVRTHIRNILTKLNVHSQLAAVAMARANRWFSTESVG